MNKISLEKTSNIAILVLVASAVLSERFRGLGFIFGTLVALAALTTLIAYVRAVARQRSLSAQEMKARFAATEIRNFAVPIAVSHANLELDVTDYLERDNCFTGVLQQGVHYRQWLSSGLLYRTATEVRVQKYDPAEIISDVVQRLCRDETSPRFEFIITPDGAFRIRPVTNKSGLIQSAASERLRTVTESRSGELPN